jgi:hypothetical protein
MSTIREAYLRAAGLAAALVRDSAATATIAAI